MTVNGYEVTQGQLQACLQVMTGFFKKEDVRDAAVVSGVPERWQAVGSSRVEDLPLLVATRIIQREVRAGHVHQDGDLHLYRRVD